MRQQLWSPSSFFFPSITLASSYVENPVVSNSLTFKITPSFFLTTTSGSRPSRCGAGFFLSHYGHLQHGRLSLSPAVSSSSSCPPTRTPLKGILRYVGFSKPFAPLPTATTWPSQM
ncbi:hypothetical protein CGCS363_v011853 [Colletotrichum siamense]|uniref:uncharacterized protein n=1 Tax=Colletotrichum siamense TaxID=690259 RepID=UPI0018733397|nr:uncharacterized protein CGCS363_v011853 [Colletotrichum siamense]KAF5489424.1 hypothetical protein CGCS363_v011853 [Colletotrichum siamense]